MSPSLSVRQAAERLGISTALVYALCVQRRIRHERHGLGRGVIRIPEDALEEYRKGTTVGTAATVPTAARRAPVIPSLVDA
jgi:excisionase family DNA binding protein